ncbi:MAG: 1-deoxy-D-xylulose-5-phosphate reductoisomerase [Nitrospirae bacterium]|nr:1-deoxy-D-xylulose-5-phosphate reductoisomerase [Nitrospirota bacterium]
MKKVTILGSTGSIGRSALKVIGANRDKFSVVGLTANTATDLLKRQIIDFKPKLVAMADSGCAKNLREWVSTTLNGTAPEVLSGSEGVCETASSDEAHMVISSIVGASGLKPTLAAIKAGKDIGLANKETLVMAGDIVKKEALKAGVKILPVDSEHNAIFQCLEGRALNEVYRIILTASGGPFLGFTWEQLKNVTVKDALKHPNWSMGSKITVDSATLMNKGLEVIEAYHLFGFTSDKIEVLIHPQSIIHPMVEFIDGEMLAQLSVPDMKGPIAHALAFPFRVKGVLKRCSLADIGALTFIKPDTTTFPCLRYAYDALDAGGTMPVVLNAANEELVGLFLKEYIKFNDIPVIIDYIMQRHNTMKADSLEEIFFADNWAREAVRDRIKKVK